MHASDDLREAFEVCVGDMMTPDVPLDDAYWNETLTDIDAKPIPRKAFITEIMIRLVDCNGVCTDQMPRALVYDVEELLESEGDLYTTRAFTYGRAAGRIINIMDKLGCYRKSKKETV